MSFELHPNLARKIFIQDLPLCRVLLEDEQHYPWIFLVPRRPDIKKMMDLSPKDQLQLMIELDQAQKVIWECFSPEQVNVAAIGNKTPQLHVHVIGRFSTDPAWPGTVWDHPVRSAYTLEERQRRVQLLQEAFLSFKNHSENSAC
jgi:diadenosine tetraphosphate (Ap4A) HIT family hydrolase